MLPKNEVLLRRIGLLIFSYSVNGTLLEVLSALIELRFLHSKQ